MDPDPDGAKPLAEMGWYFQAFKRFGRRKSVYLWREAHGGPGDGQFRMLVVGERNVGEEKERRCWLLE